MRRKVLEAIVGSLPEQHATRIQAKILLQMLLVHESEQFCLPHLNEQPLMK